MVGRRVDPSCLWRTSTSRGGFGADVVRLSHLADLVKKPWNPEGDVERGKERRFAELGEGGASRPAVDPFLFGADMIVRAAFQKACFSCSKQVLNGSRVWF